MKIKKMLLQDRPREKILRYGVNKLTNAELLAIVLSTGNKKISILDLAIKIDQLLQIKSDLSLKDLDLIKNLGQVKKTQLLALLELGKRLFLKKQTTLIMKPQDVWESLVEVRISKKEHLVIFYLDVKNQIIKKEIISIGNLNSNIVHPREVFEKAILSSAAQIIIAHNHPSGDVEPSKVDLEVTKRLVKAGRILDIEVIDHVIVTKNRWLSMKKQGLLIN